MVDAEDRRLTQSKRGDLVGHLNCRYLTELDVKVASDDLERPRIWDPVLDILAERGDLHERAFAVHLETSGFAVTRI